MDVRNERLLYGWQNFEELKRDFDAYIVYRNTKRRQVRLKGLVAEKFIPSIWAICSGTKPSKPFADRDVDEHERVILARDEWNR